MKPEVQGPHPTDLYVGRRVMERRLSLGYNQSDLARALGLTFQQVQKYEKGTNRISASKLWDAAQFLGVDIGYFFDGLEAAEPLVRQPAEVAAPHTRYTLDIAKLAPTLTKQRQRVVLQLIEELV